MAWSACLIISSMSSPHDAQVATPMPMVRELHCYGCKYYTGLKALAFRRGLGEVTHQTLRLPDDVYEDAIYPKKRAFRRF
jgi:hypothetical protein